MARTFSLASRNYAAGAYGPFDVDSFTSADTDWLLLEFSVENWPAHDALITGQMRWDSGDGADFAIRSPVRDRSGNPLAVARVRVGVPQTPDGKAAVTTGTVSMRTALALRTAVTVTAGSDAPIATP